MPPPRWGVWVIYLFHWPQGLTSLLPQNPSGRGPYSPLSCGDIESNPGPGPLSSHPSMTQCLTYLQSLNNYQWSFFIPHSGPSCNTPDAPPKAFWALCEVCGESFLVSQLDMFLSHECPDWTFTPSKTEPSFTNNPVEGRGSLLSCGDIEENPGPPPPPDIIISFGKLARPSFSLRAFIPYLRPLFPQSCLLWKLIAFHLTHSLAMSARALPSAHQEFQCVQPLGHRKTSYSLVLVAGQKVGISALTTPGGLGHLLTCRNVEHSIPTLRYGFSNEKQYLTILAGGVPSQRRVDPSTGFRMGFGKSTPFNPRNRPEFIRSRRGPVDWFSRHCLSNGPGAFLLSCGDVEANPGPPVRPEEASNPSSRGGGVYRFSSPYDPPLAASRTGTIAYPCLLCPLGCPSRWTNEKLLFRHVERYHLEDPIPPLLTQWLEGGLRRVCLHCRLLAPLSGHCFRCKGSPFIGPSPPPGGLQPAQNVEELVPDWTPLFCHQQPPIPSVPPGCSASWFEAFARECNRLQPASAVSEVHRFHAFCRLVLAPLPRGGRK